MNPLSRVTTLSNLFRLLSEKRSSLKEKNLLTLGTNSFPFRVDLFPKGVWCAKQQTGSYKSCLPCEKWWKKRTTLSMPSPSTYIGDVSARVGTDHQTWEGVIGTEGEGKCNSNDLLLLRKWAEHELLIPNTDFRQTTRTRHHRYILAPNTGISWIMS